jgi:hypothetical protein
MTSDLREILQNEINPWSEGPMKKLASSGQRFRQGSPIRQMSSLTKPLGPSSLTSNNVNDNRSSLNFTGWDQSMVGRSHEKIGIIRSTVPSGKPNKPNVLFDKTSWTVIINVKQCKWQPIFVKFYRMVNILYPRGGGGGSTDFLSKAKKSASKIYFNKVHYNIS